MPVSDFVFGKQSLFHLDVMNYASELITISRNEWLFISYKLCDFTANTKQTLFYCAKRCTNVEH